MGGSHVFPANETCFIDLNIGSIDLDPATCPNLTPVEISENLNIIPVKGHEDYVNKMMNHSKMLKDEEHMRRMEIMEEEHAIKMEINRTILEREILQLQKLRESS